MFASKSGNKGVMKSTVDTQNHGLALRMMSLAYVDVNLTIKYSLEQRWMSQSIVQLVNIQWKSSIGLGQKQLNLQIIACDSNVERCSSIFDALIFNSGMQFSNSTMYGLGVFSTGSEVVGAVFFPCRMFLYEGPFEVPAFAVLASLMCPVVLFCSVLADVFTLGDPPLSLRFRTMEEFLWMWYSFIWASPCSTFPE